MASDFSEDYAQGALSGPIFCFGAFALPRNSAVRGPAQAKRRGRISSLLPGIHTPTVSAQVLPLNGGFGARGQGPSLSGTWADGGEDTYPSAQALCHGFLTFVGGSVRGSSLFKSQHLIRLPLPLP